MILRKSYRLVAHKVPNKVKKKNEPYILGGWGGITLLIDLLFSSSKSREAVERFGKLFKSLIPALERVLALFLEPILQNSMSIPKKMEKRTLLGASSPKDCHRMPWFLLDEI